VILQRALHIALGAARKAAVVEGFGIVRFEPDGLVVILQRAVHVAFVAARSAPVVEGDGIVRLEPDGFVVILQGALQVAFSTACLSAASVPVSWLAIFGVPKSNPSSMSGTILRWLARAVSISRRNQSAWSAQPSRAEGVSRTRKCARALMFPSMSRSKSPLAMPL
jgi:hypothetical protein